MKYKHGLNQYKINHAKSFAQAIVQEVTKIELLFHLSQEGHIDEEKAQNGINNWIDEVENSCKELKLYLTPKQE